MPLTHTVIKGSVLSFFKFPFRPCKSKPTLEDVYQKQLEVLAVQLINKQLETKKLQLQIKLLERLDKEKEETTGQEMLNAILFQ